MKKRSIYKITNSAMDTKRSHDLLGNGVSMLTNIRKTIMQFRLVAEPDERFERAERIALSCKERVSA